MNISMYVFTIIKIEFCVYYHARSGVDRVARDCRECREDGVDDVRDERLLKYEQAIEYLTKILFKE